MTGHGSDPVTLDGACHCGAITFTVELGRGLATARRCDCSYCAMRGAVVVTARPDEFKLVTGAKQLATYRFNTAVAEHHFCRRCGIYTHHRRRSNPNEFGVNAACLAGVSPFDFAEVKVNDGLSHPSDRADGRGDVIAGWLRYTPA